MESIDTLTSVSHAAAWQGGLVPAPSESSFIINMTEKFQNRLCLISVCVKTDTFTETSRRNETWILLLKKYFDYAKSAFLNIFLSVSILFRMITPLFCPDVWSVKPETEGNYWMKPGKIRCLQFSIIQKEMSNVFFFSLCFVSENVI